MSDSSPSSLSDDIEKDTPNLRLLVLSNGHGEDIIAVRILQELQQQPNPPEIFVLPLVGQGYAYKGLDIRLIGSVRTMPSGGFIYMDGRQLVRDVKGGLLQLTVSQINSIRHWVNTQKKSGHEIGLLAVGDIVPLIFAWLSGANYGFVGTAKSEYYVRDDVNLLKRKDKGAWWESFSGSIYHPWERWLMTQQRCKAVFPRDSLTAEILKKWPIPAFDLGNPMMDALEPTIPRPRFYGAYTEKQELARPLVVTLLPGSRPPEAYANWHQMMIAVSALMALWKEQRFVGYRSETVVFLGAIAPSLHIESIRQILESQGWQPFDSAQGKPHAQPPIQIPDKDSLTFVQENAFFILSQNAYNDCLHQGDLAIAMAGTATEQFVGLGKPAITIPGLGPQFTYGFAEAQSRHLGPSVILVEQPAEVAQVVKSLFANPDMLQAIAENGVRRMGKSGAAQRIAEHLMELLWNRE